MTSLRSRFTGKRGAHQSCGVNWGLPKSRRSTWLPSLTVPGPWAQHRAPHLRLGSDQENRRTAYCSLPPGRPRVGGHQTRWAPSPMSSCFTRVSLLPLTIHSARNSRTQVTMFQASPAQHKTFTCPPNRLGSPFIISNLKTPGCGGGSKGNTHILYVGVLQILSLDNLLKCVMLKNLPIRLLNSEDKNALHFISQT